MELDFAHERIGWDPTPELARAIAGDSDRSLEDWALEAVQYGRTAERTLRQLLVIVQDRGQSAERRRAAADRLVKIHAAAGGATTETEKLIHLLRALDYLARKMGPDPSPERLEQWTDYGWSMLRALLPTAAGRDCRVPLRDALADWARAKDRLTTSKWKAAHMLAERAGIMVGGVSAISQAWKRHARYRETSGHGLSRSRP